MADSQAPNFDQILRETGTFTREGLQTIWSTILANETQILPASIQLAKDVFEPKEFTTAPTVDQNDLRIGKRSVLRFTGSTAVNITGIQSPDPTRLRFLIVLVTGSGTITLKNESNSSQANNRIHSKSGADITLAIDAASVLLYTNSRYRQIV